MNKLTAPIVSLHALNPVLSPLLPDFVAGLADSVAALEAATDDLRALGRLCHRFKGEAATYGYPELARALAALEAATPTDRAESLVKIQSLIVGIRAGLTEELGNVKVKTLGEVCALIVDDSEPLRLLVSHLLRAIGLRSVEMAPGGLAALTRCQEAAFDLLIIDLQMPDLSGRELILRLREHGVTCPAVAISADESPKERNLCLSSGFDAFLCKPFTQSQLEGTLKATLRTCAWPSSD